MEFTNHQIDKIGKCKKLSGGDYQYIGKNFTVEFNNDQGYWAIEEITLEVKGKEVDVFFYQFETKKDLLWTLKQADITA